MRFLYGVILIAHGSKESSAADIVAAVSQKTEGLLSDAKVEYGFLSQGDVSFDEAIHKLKDNGVNEVIIMPYFLYDGPHVTRDIQRIADELSLKHKEMSIIIASPLGIDERLAEIAADRIRAIRREKNGI